MAPYVFVFLIGVAYAQSGCYFEGETYQQGEQWTKACQYNCVCQDASKGAYRCTEMCPTFNSLPQGCSMKKIDGECCAKPDCDFLHPQAGHTGAVITGTLIPTIPSGTHGTCTNKLHNCAEYGKTVCSQEKYRLWVKENCCAFCSGGVPSLGTNPGSIIFGGTHSTTIMIPTKIRTTIAPSTCNDAIGDCAEYGTTICSQAMYQPWVQKNCCRYCSGITSGVITGTMGQHGTVTGMPHVQGQVCADKRADCKAYGSSVCGDTTYEAWVKENCASFCNKCQPTVTGTCVDKQKNCATYDSTVCSDQKYKPWALENCAKTCNLCPSQSASTPGGMTHTNTGINTGTGTGISGQSSGCVYKGKVYSQGQKFVDGCDYKCTCADAPTGKYMCSSMCYQWNLPSACSLNPPVPGKCCKTPNCPAGYTIKYPQGYTEE